VKTVCHVLPYLAEGGTEKTAYNIIRGLKSRYRMLLFAPRGPALGDFLELGIECAEFPALKGNPIGKIGEYKKRLRQLHDQYGIDLLHVHAAHEFLSFSQKAVRSVPMLFHLHSHQGSHCSKIINYRLSAVIARRKARLLVAVSEEEKRIIVSNGFPEDRVAVVYNGFEPEGEDDWEMIAGLRHTHALEGCSVIGNLGRLNRTKRLDILINAFRMLQKK
jgi:glycosyltransferase involved in cell wall biosynthesis